LADEQHVGMAGAEINPLRRFRSLLVFNRA